MKLQPALTALLLLGALARAGAAQDARLNRRFDVATVSRLSALIDSVKARGVPAEPLVQKALEGASKGASSELIVTAVRGLAQRLQDAQGALADAGTAELVAGAAALEAGARPADLRRWRDQASGERLTTALIGSTYLLQRGITAEGAFSIVQSMLEAKLSPSDFVTLQRLVDQDIRAGAPAAEAARLRSRALIQQRSNLRNNGGL